MHQGEEQVKVGGIGLGAGLDESILMAKKMLGLNNVNVIQGYGGLSEQYLALKQGELDGIVVPLIGYEQHELFREMYDDGTAHVVLELGGQEPAEGLRFLTEGVPKVRDLIEDSQDLKIFDTYIGMLNASRIFIVPPETPEEYVRLLRDAYADTMADEEFLQEAQEVGFLITPLLGDTAEKAFRGVLELPPDEEQALLEIFTK